MLRCIEQLEDLHLYDEPTGVAEESAAVVRHMGKVVINFDEMETIDFQAVRW